MLRPALIAAFLAAVAPPASAAQSPQASPAPMSPLEAALIGQFVDMPPVGLPIIVHGQLVNYVFVYVRVNLTASADVTAMRNREPFFRDALVRMAHRTPFTRPDDYNRVDEARVCAALMREITPIAGPGNIRSVVITSQSPQHRISKPKS